MNKKLLVVEDDRSSLTLLTYALGQEGYEVLAASDGFAGLKTVQDEHPILSFSMLCCLAWMAMKFAVGCVNNLRLPPCP